MKKWIWTTVAVLTLTVSVSAQITTNSDYTVEPLRHAA